ncbi:GGDEF domain-containing protein, partial [Shewanella chilikensis]|uniref:GGDEF domain-containing protein n=1 Tax=Shewanella chilikensis TaxID=558541 RepID=UPI001F3E1E6D
NEYSKNSQYSFYDQGLFNNIIIETFDVPIVENNTVPYYMSLGEVLKRDALVIFLILLLTLKFFIIKIGQQENKETNVRLNIATTELNKDALTGLLNRRHLSNLLKNENLDNYTITMIDGNKFKNINDTYGHSIGDLVIKHVANTLYTYTRHSDLVYRLGGDEFLILFLNMPGEAIDNLMAKINSILKKSIINEHTIPISISYGYAHICNYKCHEEALKMADDLLYRSKRSALETP